MIYCVEDDEAAGNLEAYALETSGYGVELFSDGKSFFQALAAERPELVLLDIMLPGDDGITILRKLKGDPVSADIPVIMTTAKGTEFDKVRGLDLGADDYLVKPFGMMEMVSRVRAVLRRTSARASEAPVLVAEGVSVNRTEHTVTVDGQKIDLTLKEYGLLELFMEYPGRVFDRETLLARVWNSEYTGDTRTVDVHIGTLRTKLGHYGGLIQTIRGLGYKLEADAS